MMTMAMVCYCYCLSPCYLKMTAWSWTRNYLKINPYPVDYCNLMSVVDLLDRVEEEVILFDLVTCVFLDIEVGREVAVVVVDWILTMYHWWQFLEVLCGSETF